MRVVLVGELSNEHQWDLAGEKVRVADFSALTTPGSYSILVGDMGYSYPFEIKEHVLRDAFLGSIKGLYYQRSGMALEKAHAGKWYRPKGHPDDSIPFHASSGKKEGFIRSSKGWYDAGDYNKYVVNGSFPLGQFFQLYEQYPEAVKDGELNIPESGNGTSDYMDELRYEMDWLLTMQDEDGGLFHKLTAKGFEGMIMPHKAISQRYIVGKGTTATLDFAAVAAQAYRVFFKTDPLYANRCLTASKRAYEWATMHPAVGYVNPEDITTGQYRDEDFEDEWFWANAELFVTTKDATYLNSLMKNPIDFEFTPGESWTAFMRFLGVFSMLQHQVVLPEEVAATLKRGILGTADALVQKGEKLDYFQAVDDFQWGSNSDVLNAAIICAQAYRLDPKKKYISAAQHAVNYVLGNNAMGYSYLTGFGSKTPMFIHHRQSEADGIDDPVPGLLAGGPNSRMQDTVNGVAYPINAAPMRSWADVEPSYASNEICLNWNAPLTYVLGFLEQEAQ